MIINEEFIVNEIKTGKNSSHLNDILKKAENGHGLTGTETSALFQQLDGKSLKDALRIAAELKSRTKGNFASLYTCLYITNSCVNDCGYCGYRGSNKDLERITLTPFQIEDEARAILEMGVTNAILIGGTMPEELYKGLIVEGTRRIVKGTALSPWIEFENLSPQTLRHLYEVGARHFVLFQETYNRAKYRRLHSNSPLKGDYDARLRKVDEAVDSGFRNIGIGALFGLQENHVFEVLGLYHHAWYLMGRGVGVCISIPTLKPAPGLSISSHGIEDEELIKIAATLRLALPDVSLALSARETTELRNRLFPIIDQIGSGGTPNPGGRTSHKAQYRRGDTQFRLSDTRSPREVIEHLATRGIEVKRFVKWQPQLF